MIKKKNNLHTKYYKFMRVTLYDRWTDGIKVDDVCSLEMPTVVFAYIVDPPEIGPMPGSNSHTTILANTYLCHNFRKTQ